MCTIKIKLEFLNYMNTRKIMIYNGLTSLIRTSLLDNSGKLDFQRNENLLHSHFAL